MTRGRPIEQLADADTGWMAEANCRGVDPAVFFVERGEPVYEAKALCRGCVVRDACLAYAEANNIRHGVFGGMTPTERRRRGLRIAQGVTVENRRRVVTDDDYAVALTALVKASGWTRAEVAADGESAAWFVCQRITDPSRREEAQRFGVIVANGRPA